MGNKKPTTYLLTQQVKNVGKHKVVSQKSQPAKCGEARGAGMWYKMRNLPTPRHRLKQEVGLFFFWPL